MMMSPLIGARKCCVCVCCQPWNSQWSLPSKALFQDSGLCVVVRLFIFHTQNMTYCAVWLFTFPGIRCPYTLHFLNVSPSQAFAFAVNLQEYLFVVFFVSLGLDLFTSLRLSSCYIRFPMARWVPSISRTSAWSLTLAGVPHQHR